jgi:pyrophosphatase PpaX
MREPRFKAILFDLDGTIADTHHLIHSCFDYAMHKHVGHGMEREEWEEWVGVPLNRLFPAAFEMRGLSEPDADMVRSMTLTYRARLEEVDSTVQAFPGMSEVLDALRAFGVRMSVVTTKHEQALTRTLANLGLTSHFEYAVAGDHCTNYKPHPEPFDKAASLMNLPPESCAVVGDSTADILGGAAAGMQTAAAMWGVLLREKVLAAKPTVILHSPEEILEFAGVVEPTAVGERHL